MILHIPHASTAIAEDHLDAFLLSDVELLRELYVMTDWHTDRLFDYRRARKVVFPWSRLLVDVERFPDDTDEPMSGKGMGRFYTRTHDGRPLRRPPRSMEVRALRRLYDANHRELEDAVEEELQATGRALIVDGHSFPDMPLPCDRDQSTPRPDICIGTDPFHTPKDLAGRLVGLFRDRGYSVSVNTPFSGALVPLRYYRGEPRVRSVMIEVNRRLYLHNPEGLSRLRSGLRDILEAVDPETPGPERRMEPETNENPPSPHRVDWSDATLQRELEAAFRKGYLVLPNSRVAEVEICNIAFEPAGRIALPDCGHVILRLKELRR